MNNIEETIKNLEIKEIKIHINAISDLNIEKNKIVKFKAFNEQILLYLKDGTIKVYNCSTLKEITTLKLGLELIFNREIETNNVEFLENEMILIVCNNRLYFFKMNIKDNKL